MTSFPFASIAAARAGVSWVCVKTTAHVPPTRGWVAKVHFILMWNEFVLWIMHHSTGDTPSSARWELKCVKALAFCLSNKRRCSVLRSNPRGFGLVFFSTHCYFIITSIFVMSLKRNNFISWIYFEKENKLHDVISVQAHLEKSFLTSSEPSLTATLLHLWP